MRRAALTAPPQLGVALAGVSLLALVVAGIGWAAGYDPAGACGGG